MSNKAYKVLKPDEWAEATSTEKIITDLDKRDGFIHLSTASQLATTLSFYFQDFEEVILLQLDLDKINKDKYCMKNHTQTKEKEKVLFHTYIQNL